MAEVTETLQFLNACYPLTAISQFQTVTVLSIPFSTTNVSNVLITSLNESTSGLGSNSLFTYSVYLDGVLVGSSQELSSIIAVVKGVAAGNHTVTVTVAGTFGSSSASGSASVIISVGM